MASYWIKVEFCTPNKPEVLQMAQILQLEPDAVLGKLIRVWSWFDEQTENGNAHSVTKAFLDDVTRVTGFCDAMTKVGWMRVESGVDNFDNSMETLTISLPNFDRHNGESAKKRALTARRVEKSRALKCNADSVTKALPDIDIDIDKDISTIKKNIKKKKVVRFVKPTVMDLKMYAQENNLDVSPELFYDYYESNGWTVGKNSPMKNWQATMRNWDRRKLNDKPRSTPPKSPRNPSAVERVEIANQKAEAVERKQSEKTINDQGIIIDV